jgi:predicted MFS family arabinose efflux permease
VKLLRATRHLLFGLYADGFWSATVARALTGIGWAGTYMIGLKLLADSVDSKLMSRATAGHAASIGISGAASFACADLFANVAGWRTAFIVACISAAIAWALVAWAVPRRKRVAAPAASGRALFDFRPVLRNRSVMAYATVYCFHTLEMNALRGWGVAYLAFVAASTTSPVAVLSPAVTLTVLGLAGTVASLLGNEVAIRLGRRRLIGVALIASASCACLLGLIGPWSYPLAAALLVIYGPVVWLDSSSLTAGAAGTADPAKRGATLAVHSMLGYMGGFVGLLIVGWSLDLDGSMSHATWTAAFLIMASFSIIGFIALWLMRPRELAGDREA